MLTKCLKLAVAFAMAVAVVDGRIHTPQQRELVEDELPTPEELFGLLGIFGDVCDGPLAFIFKRRCEVVEPVDPSKAKGKGKRSRNLALADDELPTPEELFGLLGIFGDVCDGPLAFIFKRRCAEPVDPSKASKAKGKGKRSRNLALADDELPTPEELFGLLGIFGDVCDGPLAFIFKRRCEVVEPVEPSKAKGKGKRSRNLVLADEELPTPEELFGLLGIFGDVCDGPLAFIFKRRCETVEPVEPSKAKGKGKRSRNLVLADDELPTPEELFGLLGIFGDVCDGPLAFIFKRKCAEEPTVESKASKAKGKGKRSRNLA